MTVAAMEALDRIEAWMLDHSSDKTIAPLMEDIDTIRAAFPAVPNQSKLERQARLMEIALEGAAETFRRYERMHNEKKPPDHLKAMANCEKAMNLEYALTDYRRECGAHPAEWHAIKDAPHNGTPIVCQYVTTYRFQPYSQKSQQYKQGQRGRWQQAGEYGGWDNCPAPAGPWRHRTIKEGGREPDGP